MAWLDYGNPMIYGTLPLSLSRLSRLFGNWLVRKNTNPYFSFSFQVTIDRDSSRFYLIGSHPSARQRLYSEFTKRNGVASRSGSSHSAFVDLAIFGTGWK
jgi:hypothetical protein